MKSFKKKKNNLQVLQNHQNESLYRQKKLIFNFFVTRNWKKLTDSRKRAQILADNRKSHHPIETLLIVSGA